jgi:hypothetical protein
MAALLFWALPAPLAVHSYKALCLLHSLCKPDSQTIRLPASPEIPSCANNLSICHCVLQGRTALAIAVYFLDARPKRSLGIVQALLAAGADPLCHDFHGIGSLLLRWAAGGWLAVRAGVWIAGGWWWF